MLVCSLVCTQKFTLMNLCNERSVFWVNARVQTWLHLSSIRRNDCWKLHIFPMLWLWQVSDQKPLGSWTVKQGQSLTCSTVYNSQNKEYVAVSDSKVGEASGAAQTVETSWEIGNGLLVTDILYVACTVEDKIIEHLWKNKILPGSILFPPFDDLFYWAIAQPTVVQWCALTS